VRDAVGEFPKFMEVDCPLHCADTIPDSPPEMETIKVHGDEIEENMDFFIPVLPPFFVFFFVFLLSGLAFLRERGSGTAERLLASPLGKAELVTGYVLGFLPPALVQSTVVILFSLFVLGGPWGGWALVASVLLLCLVAECLGVFVSAFARTEFQVFQFIPLMILPQLLLSGIIWPVCDFPEWLKPVAYCLPLTYAVEAVRDAAIRGFGFDQLWQHLAALAGFVVLGIALASLSVRRTL
jgi:ABC-2 type transport system permease protein